MAFSYALLCFSALVALCSCWRLLKRVQRLEYIVEHAHQPQAPADGWV